MLSDYILGLGQVMDREILFGTLSAISNPLINSTTGCAVTVSNPATMAQLNNLYHAIDPSIRMQAQWVFSNDTHADLVNLADAASRLIFNPGATGSVAGNVPGTLLGLPINTSSMLPAGGTTGSVVLTVPSNFILAVGVSGVKSAFSDDVYFLSDQRVWRFDYRVNGCPRNASKITLLDSTIVSATAYES
jgi:HK97 family phage major capsid protein